MSHNAAYHDRVNLPAVGCFGADEFIYTIQDPDGLTDTASVFVTVDNIDDSVLAYDDWACAPMNGTGHLIDVLAKDDDPDGDTLNIMLPGQGLAPELVLTTCFMVVPGVCSTNGGDYALHS